MNTAIWLADPPGENLVILDNLGWYYDVIIFLLTNPTIVC